MKKLLFAVLVVGLISGLGSCTKVEQVVNTLYKLGWLGTDDPSKIPTSISPKQFGNTTLPASVDLVPKFPPIGDQGQYGTCVAWAAGYNLKTAIHGMDEGFSTSQLAQTNNQMSPRDLFVAIDDNKKGASDCNGTNLQYALDVMLNRGVASLQTAPYVGNEGGCSQANLQSSWTSDASNHKIKNYRKIAVDKQEIKGYLSQNQPVLIGAKLSDAFMTWNTDDVMMGNTTYDRVGQHAYHALVIGGYDDSKGPNGAFKIINSWSQNWGARGYIWIDQNFAVNEFIADGNCYVATNLKGGNTPPSPDPVQSGNIDLAPWAYVDSPLTGTSRQINWDVFNIGGQNAASSSGWYLYYIIYNAYNANDYEILFANQANSSIPSGAFQCGTTQCDFNIDIPGGSSLATAASAPFAYNQYTIPSTLNGSYYLLLYADALDVVAEQDEANNLFYTTSQYPVTIQNGLVVGKTGSEDGVDIRNFQFRNTVLPSRDVVKGGLHKTAVTEKNRNAYAPEEIKLFLKNEIKTGRFQAKAMQALHNAGLKK
ncbi:MAG: C1 family peptidase [Chitinophagales bacterium]